jgi:hypothetical protein
MLIKFKNASGKGIHNPLRWGEGDDVHIAVCSMYALKLYEQAFMEEPASKHHSLINDVMDTGEDGEGTFSALVGIDWDADMRATWAMLRSADVAGLNKGVDPTPDYAELIESHAADIIDFSDLHECVTKEIDATFRTLSARFAKAAREAARQGREGREGE